MKRKKVMIVAGEHSGDRLGSFLVRELFKRSSQLEIFGIGGTLMQKEGVRLIEDLTDFAVIGLWEVLKHYRVFKKVFKKACQTIEEEQPDLLVLIDFPGFNLRLAKAAKKRNVKVVYYVSPQFWAWGGRRVHVVKSAVDKMLVILPFEKAFYDRHQIACEFVGHPLVDWNHASYHLDELRSLIGSSSPVLGVLPGSRKNEVRRHLDILLHAAQMLQQDYPQAKFLVPCASDYIYEFVQERVKGLPSVKLLHGSMHECFRVCDLVWVTSGTATLEAGYAGVPMIVVYKISKLTEWIARLLIKVPYIALVNLVAGEKLVPELLQSELTSENLKNLSMTLIENTPERVEMQKKLAGIKEKLGPIGASERAAKSILQFLEVAA